MDFNNIWELAGHTHYATIVPGGTSGLYTVIRITGNDSLPAASVVLSVSMNTSQWAGSFSAQPSPISPCHAAKACTVSSTIQT